MRKMFTKVLIVFVSFLLLSSCRDDVDKYYERPDYLRGNAYEYLKEKGNYTLFIQGLELAGYKNALDGRGLYSVFAPDDNAFRRYMDKKGKATLQDFNLDSLKMLISYHLIEFSFNRTDFLEFTKTASAEEPEEGTGICYKYETLAQEKATEMEDPQTGRTVKVFKQRKFLPVISTKLLRTQESTDYAGDYKMFFPSIKWQGDQSKLYVANAAVVQSGIPIDNGYMYLIDEVVEPLPTVYTALSANRPGTSFKVFRELYDRFAYVVYDPENTKLYAQVGDSLFNYYHYMPPTNGEDLPDIANEWTVSTSESDYEARLKYAFNCFAPTDEVLVPYLQNFFEVANVEEVPLLSLYYLLKAHCANRKTIVLPSLIDNGFEGELGEDWGLERKDLVVSQFCSNGILYGVNKILEPAVFTMVMKPLFQYPRFSTMLNVGHKQDIYKEMIDPERDFTIFVVPDDKLKEKNGYYVDYYANPASTDVITGRVAIKTWTDKDNHTPRDMTGEEQAEFIDGQIANSYVDPERNANKRVFHAMRNRFHFIYTENGRMYGETQTELAPYMSWQFTYPNGDGRGLVYEIEDKLQMNEENIGMALFKSADKFQKFYSALLKAKLIQVKPEGAVSAADIKSVELDWLNGERCMVFAPTNEAWDDTQIPADSVELDRFLKYFFIPLTENKQTDYILPNYGTPGEFDTRYAYTPTVKAKMKVEFADDKSLRIRNSAGDNVLTDGDVPFFATDGVIFGIKGLITGSK